MKKRVNNDLIVRISIVLITLVVCFFIYSLVDFYVKKVKTTLGKPIYSFDNSTYLYKDQTVIDSSISELYLSYGISYGIDVSEWQGHIDWEKVANTGISFAMIRCGFRGIKGSNIYEDANFKENIEGATQVGLKVGVYFLGTAKNTEEAVEEAEFVMSKIKDYDLSYPVVYDIETVGEGRLAGIDRTTITNNVLTFTETVASYGYDTMIYSNKNTFTNKLYTGKFAGKLIWLAHYVEKTNYTGEYSMWQYTKDGLVDGINGNVDLNISYFKYVENISDIEENPMLLETPYVTFEEIDEVIKLKNKIYYRNSPTLDLPNIVGDIDKGNVIKRTGISDNISRITHEGKNYYVSNEELE